MADTRPKGSISSLHDTLSVANIPVAKIYVRPQYRQNFDHVPALAENIRQNGLQQPIVVFKSRREEGYSYELVSGESRLRATKLLERDKIAASICAAPTGELERVTLQLSENVQRSDLTALEMALAADDLHQQFSLKRQEIADLLCVSVRAVARYRTITAAMESHPDAKSLLMRLNSPEISTRHMAELANLAMVHMELAGLITRDLERDPSSHTASRIAQVSAAISDFPSETEHLLSQLDTETQDPNPILAFLEGIDAVRHGEVNMPPEAPETAPPPAKPKAKRPQSSKTMKPTTYRATQALYQGKTGQVSWVIFIDEEGARHELPLEEVELGLEEVSE